MDASPATAHIKRRLATSALVGPLLFLFPFWAHAATLSFSPQSGTYFAGRSFSVSVLVSSPDQAMNAVQGEISFPTKQLEVLSISQTNSIVTLWVQNPTFSNQDGTIDFGGVSPNPGFQGNGGNIITIRFEAKNSGSAMLAFNSGSVLANDGMGTDILTSMGSANLTIAPLVSAPASTASTLGNTGILSSPIIINSTPSITLGQWYNLDQISFNWSVPADAEGVDYTISNDSNLQLSDVNQGMASQASYDLSQFSDGVWYFFVSFESGDTWSPPAVKEVMLDRTPPEPFVITRVDTIQSDVRPVFAWTANDGSSGIDHYDVKIGDGDWFNASSIQNGSSSYMLPLQSLTSSRKLTVRAFDKAGNFTDASINFSVSTIGEPCEASAFFCEFSLFVTRWMWIIFILFMISAVSTHAYIFHLLRWKSRSLEEMKKFKDELRNDLKVLQRQAEKESGVNVDLRPAHLSEKARQLEKDIQHVSDEVKEEVKKLDKVE